MKLIFDRSLKYQLFSNLCEERKYENATQREQKGMVISSIVLKQFLTQWNEAWTNKSTCRRTIYCASEKTQWHSLWLRQEQQHTAAWQTDWMSSSAQPVGSWHNNYSLCHWWQSKLSFRRNGHLFCWHWCSVVAHVLVPIALARHSVCYMESFFKTYYLNFRTGSIQSQFRITYTSYIVLLRRLEVRSKRK